MRAATLALLLLGCSASTDPGLSARLQIAGAQFVPGAMPDASDGPAVIAMNLTSNRIVPGARDQPLLGTLAAGATGVAFALDGDQGYWVLPAGVPDTETPTLPSFAVRMSFAVDLTPGTLMLIGRAVDADGRFGAPRTAMLTVADVPPPSGKLVISLHWDRSVDLDLHVLDPTGAEVWANKPSAYLAPPPPQTPDPEAARRAGALDLDSNSGCVIDGRDRENVIYKNTAPAGHYLARVDTFSLCGQVSAEWAIEAWVDGQVVARGSGISLDSDTMGAHDQGAGLTALEFDLR